ncbi:MAG: archaellin/type IV pilin N-terminal domain-containing protein [Nanoarchaeota archaeon]
MKKRGISPVIATVLLIAMVVVLGLIIFLWFRGFTQEAVTKFDTNVELVCNDVSFDASYSGGILSIVNTGNIPIYRVKLKTSGQGSYSTKELATQDGWSEVGLNQGDAFSNSTTDINGAEEIIIIPVLMGNSRSGQQSFTCNEVQHGHSITL